MIEAILPAPVVVAEAIGEHVDEGDLFPVECARVARAVDKRRREFATGRACARRALSQLGQAATAIGAGERGEPLWPEGVVGSITHCDGYAAAAVAREGDLRTVGIDAEPDAPLPQGVLDRIALPVERERLRELAGADRPVAWDRLLFSAKEAVYKAWFPLTGAWLGFDDAVVAIDPVGGAIDARLVVPRRTAAGAPLTWFAGRWLADAGLVLTAVARVG